MRRVAVVALACLLAVGIGVAGGLLHAAPGGLQRAVPSFSLPPVPGAR